MVKEVEERLGFIDVLVNNAGIAMQKLFTDTSDSEWNNMLATNLNSVFYCAKAVAPAMIREHRGCIINIASMWGEVGASCEVAYSAAKAGVIGFTKALAKELGPSGIRVNAISPGVIMTDMMAGFSDDDVAALREETPLCTLGAPEDIARSAVFLASDRARYISGQVLGVNGGMVI
jgi:3-oxoacyl-[acyl-carrier protein] reductase